MNNETYAHAIKRVGVVAALVVTVITRSLPASAFIGNHDEQACIAGVSAMNVVPLGFYGRNFKSSAGYGASLQIAPSRETMHTLFGWKYFFFQASFAYAAMAMKESADSRLSLYSISAGPVFYYPLYRWAYPFTSVSLGGYCSTLELDASRKTAENYNACGAASAGVMFPLLASTMLRLDATYSWYAMREPLSSVAYGVSAHYNISFDGSGSQLARKESLVQISATSIADIFPARKSYYNASGIGTVTIENVGRNPLGDVKIETEIGEVTDFASSTEKISEMAPGEKKTVVIRVTLNDAVMKLVEDRYVPVRFRVVYKTKTAVYSYVEYDNILVHHKNALSWEDSAALASFIMPKDESVAAFSGKAVSEYSAHMMKGVSGKLQQAMHLFAALGAAGITYKTDPSGGYNLSAKSKSAVDYAQFPRETLERKSGDCDDLTALYASVLEHAGIRTAIVTVPGHVFLMFDTEIPEAARNELGAQKGEYSIRNATVWIPVEVTKLGRPFTQAWDAAAKKMRLFAGSGMSVVETEIAWKSFPPADMNREDKYSPPDIGDARRYIARDIDVIKNICYTIPMQAKLDALKKDPNDYRAWNNIGILHGQFGEYEKAMDAFGKAAALKPLYAPARTNIGTVLMLRGDYANAINSYEKSLEVDPDSVIARINLAKALYEKGEYEKARAEYERVIAKNPEFMRLYAYLGGKKQGDKKSGGEHSPGGMWVFDENDDQAAGAPARGMLHIKKMGTSRILALSGKVRVEGAL